MKLTRVLLVILVIFLFGGTLPAQGQMGTLHDPGELADWCTPTVIYAEAPPGWSP